MDSIFDKAFANDLDYVKNNIDKVNLIDERGKTLLHHAVLGSAFLVIEFLLLNKVSPNIKDQSGETPIYDCARKAKLRIAKTLINNGANVNVENKKREMPIHLASHKGDLDFIKLLVENGSILNSKNSDDKLPIHYAILGGNIDCLEYLIQASKESWLQRDFQGNSLLHYATRTTNANLVAYLLSKELNPNSLNDQFETPLFNAMRYGNKEIINILINEGALVNVINRRYETPFDVALIFNQDDNHQYLTERIKEPNIEKIQESQRLTVAVLNRDHIELAKLVQTHTQMKKDRLGKTALDYAKEYKLETCIKLLQDYVN